MDNTSLEDCSGWNTYGERQFLTISNPLKMLNEYEIKVHLKMNTPVKHRYLKQKLVIQSPRVQIKKSSVDLALPKIKRQLIRFVNIDMDSCIRRKRTSGSHRNSCQLKNSYTVEKNEEKQSKQMKKMRQISVDFRTNKILATPKKKILTHRMNKQDMISATQKCLNNILKEKSMRAKKNQEKVFSRSFLKSIKS